MNQGMPLAQRFWMKVDKTPGSGPWGNCWEWRGGKTGAGYGQLSAFGEKKYATHVRYFLKHGRWPKKQRNHTCDNRGCIRLDHTYAGTKKQNAQDSVRRGRWSIQRGERNGKAKLNEPLVRLLLAELAGRLSQRKLARKYLLNRAAIADISAGRTWRHVSLIGKKPLARVRESAEVTT